MTISIVMELLILLGLAFGLLVFVGFIVALVYFLTRNTNQSEYPRQESLSKSSLPTTSVSDDNPYRAPERGLKSPMGITVMIIAGIFILFFLFICGGVLLLA